MARQSLVLTIVTVTLFVLITCQQITNKTGVSTALVSKFARPLTDTQILPTPARLARGEYLANGILRCFHCHAMVDTTQAGWPPLAGKIGAGRILLNADSERLVAPNITPDKETGAGNWTDDMFLRAIKEGIGHDGRALTFMPWWTYRQLADEDIASLIVYLKSLPAIHHELPRRIFTAAREKRLQNEQRPMKDPANKLPDTSDVLIKGKYLVTIGECEGCHTAWYKRNPGFFAGGNPIANDDTDSVIVSANISPGIGGISGWDDKTFIRVMRTGKGGQLHHSMPWIAFRHISDEDLKAILAALKLMPPIEHHIVNGQIATLCEVCGEKHGYGEHNKAIAITPVKVDESLFSLFAGKYADSTGFVARITFKNNKLFMAFEEEGLPEIELIPVGENKFNGAGLPSPINFMRDEKGNVKSFVDQDMMPVTFLKI